MTYSIVARDAETGAYGIAVASRFFAVGARDRADIDRRIAERETARLAAGRPSPSRATGSAAIEQGPKPA